MSNVQAVLFNKHQWTATEARRCLKAHDYKPIKHVDITLNLLRYRIKQPSSKERYRLQTLGTSGIKLVLGYI